MKILYLVHQFFPEYYGGTERFTLSLAEQMQRMGNHPLVVTCNRGSNHEGYASLHKGILHRRYVYGTIPVISLKQSVSHRVPEIFDDQFLQAFKKLRLECDIVHVTHPWSLSSIARWYKDNKIPVVLTLTDPWLLCPRVHLLDLNYGLCSGPEGGRRCISNCDFGRESIARYRDAMSLLELADVVASASKFTASLFKENGCIKKIRVIPHSIDYRYVKPVDDLSQTGTNFGFIGSLLWHKGVHVLVKAFRKVSLQNIRLEIYGSYYKEGHYFRELLELAKGDGRIQFLGPFDMNALPDIMKDISVLVVPSVYFENYPLVMLIGLAYKVPVIASDIGGMPEVIKHGVNGFLFKMGDVDELAQILEKIARDPRIIEELRNNIVTPRRTEEEALDYENIYRELIGLRLSPEIVQSKR